jgi:hypothetical protein
MNNSPQYQSVTNRPIGCTFCGATVNGRIVEKKVPQIEQTIKEIHWICNRCGNLVRVGRQA